MVSHLSLSTIECRLRTVGEQPLFVHKSKEHMQHRCTRFRAVVNFWPKKCSWTVQGIDSDRLQKLLGGPASSVEAEEATAIQVYHSKVLCDLEYRLSALGEEPMFVHKSGPHMQHRCKQFHAVVNCWPNTGSWTVQGVDKERLLNLISVPDKHSAEDAQLVLELPIIGKPLLESTVVAETQLSSSDVERQDCYIEKGTAGPFSNPSPEESALHQQLALQHHVCMTERSESSDSCDYGCGCKSDELGASPAGTERASVSTTDEYQVLRDELCLAKQITEIAIAQRLVAEKARDEYRDRAQHAEAALKAQQITSIATPQKRPSKMHWSPNCAWP